MLKQTCFVVCSLVSSAALATPIAVVNPGFEDIDEESAFNEFTFGPLDGWDLYDPAGITAGGAGDTFFIGTLTPQVIDNAPDYEFFPDGAPEGMRVGIAFNFFGSGGTGIYGMQQTLAGTPLLANTTYTLEVEIGNIASGRDVLGNNYDLSGFPGYRVELLAGGVVVASDDNTLAGTIPNGQWATSTVTLTTGDAHAQLGQDLGIRLISLNQVDPLSPGSDLEVDFDHVRLDASAVPEPKSIAMLLVGAILATRRRR